VVWRSERAWIVMEYVRSRSLQIAVQADGPFDHAGLRLITCGGPFDSASGHYVDNIVVYADLVTTERR